MNNSAIDYLLSIPMFQSVGISAMNPSLDKITVLDNMLKHPHESFTTIHVGGTNGKGSVSHMLCSVLMNAGFSVGLYTSPHLHDFRERIRVNGEMIDTESIEKFVDTYKDNIEELKPSFFEITTALAFDFFKKSQVDFAVVEVGLGGIYDATNIVTPLLSVITNISKDHVNILGDTIPEIAFQKAGIIKDGVPVVIGEYDSESGRVFGEAAIHKRSEIRFADIDYKLISNVGNMYELEDLSGETISVKCELTGYAQQKNLLTLLTACDILMEKDVAITRDNIFSGLENCATITGLKGRWQKLSENPLIICDTAHNEAGIKEVVRQLKSMNCARLYIVLAMVSDKDITSVLSLLPAEAYYIFTRAKISRALDETKLSQLAHEAGLTGETSPSVAMAIEKATSMATDNDVIFIGGSNFTVAEINQL